MRSNLSQIVALRLKIIFLQKLFDDKSRLLSDLVLILARDRYCFPHSYSKFNYRFDYQEYREIFAICMKFDIYFLTETDGILKWEEMGIFGKQNHDEGTLFFPKIIRTSKNDIFPFGPEIHLVNHRYDHQNGSQILFENWTKNMSREIDENFPLTVTNRMSLLRILQI